MLRKKTSEERIKLKVDKNFGWMYDDYKNQRHLSAILGSCGFIYNNEFEIAKGFFLSKMKELEEGKHDNN